MALTMTEAHAVNTLLQWLIGERPDRLDMTSAPTSEDACDAAALLADHAHKTLMAGWTRQGVENLWPESEAGGQR